MAERLTFACGELRPGKARIDIPGIKPPAPPVLIPSPDPCCTKIPGPPGKIPLEEWVCICDKTCEEDPFACEDPSKRRCINKLSLPPGIPAGPTYSSKSECEDKGFGESPCWVCSYKCVERAPTLCPDGRSTKRVNRECVKCANAKNKPVECVFPSLTQCLSDCQSKSFDCPTPGQLPPAPGGTRPDTPGSSQPQPGRPVTPESRYRCVEERIYCPDGRTVKQIKRRCEFCGVSTDPKLPPDCTLTNSNCLSLCNSSPEMTCPDRQIIEPGGGAGSSQPVLINNQGQQVTQRSGGQVTLQTILKPAETVNTTILNLNSLASKQSNYVSGTIYSPQFNLFQYPPTTEIKLVANRYKTNIFKETVAKEIFYILQRNGGIAPWLEFPYTQVTKEKIAISLNDNLLTAFNSIAYQNGQLVSIDYFLEMVWRLLVTNRLDELNPDFYVTLANKQKDDQKIIIQRSESQNIQERVALGILSEEAISADPNKNEGIQALQLRRSKRLNTDIEAYIETEDLSNAVSPLPLPDSGFVIEAVDEGIPLSLDTTSVIPVIVPLGEGDGYYISATLEDNSVIPIYVQNSLSSSYIIGPDTRQTALDLFNVAPDIVLQSTLTSGSTEFDEGYDVSSTTLDVMYFSLNLSSIGESITTNSLVVNLSAIYNLLEDQDAINAHSLSYGLDVTRVNVDYRDPFVVYAKGSQQITLLQNDISFKNLLPTRTANNQILTRTLPFALVIVPGKGSQHNPFGTGSKLGNLGDSVTRELRLIPTINKSQAEQYVPALEEKLLYDDRGAFAVGLVESPNTQNIVYKFATSSVQFDNTSYTEGTVSSAPFGARPEPIGKVVKELVDTLNTKYDVSSLTWWDIYRRLTADQMATLAVEMNDQFFKKFSKGYRTGIEIRDVLNRAEDYRSGIGQELNTAIEDTIILTEENRGNATSY